MTASELLPRRNAGESVLDQFEIVGAIKPIQPHSFSTGIKPPSLAKTSLSFTAGSQKPPSSAKKRNPPKPYMRRVPWNGSPSRRNRAEPPSAPLAARRPAEFIVTGDRQFDLASSVRSPVQTRSTFYRYPFCRWPARFSGLDSRRGRCLAETPAERLRFSGGRDSETGSGARPMWLRTLAFKVGRRVRISFAPAGSLLRT